MIVEHEVIEQIEEEAGGRPFPWVCRRIRELGRDDGCAILRALWAKGHVELVDGEGQALPRWACEAAFRDERVPDGVHVRATDRGSAWVHGTT